MRCYTQTSPMLGFIAITMLAYSGMVNSFSSASQSVDAASKDSSLLVPASTSSRNANQGNDNEISLLTFLKGAVPSENAVNTTEVAKTDKKKPSKKRLRKATNTLSDNQTQEEETTPLAHVPTLGY